MGIIRIQVTYRTTTRSLSCLMIMGLLIVTIQAGHLSALPSLNDWKDSQTHVLFPELSNRSFSPSLAFDSHDNLHVVWADCTDYNNAGPDCDIFHSSLNAGDSTWIDPQVISLNSTDHSFTPAVATDSRDNIHVVWTDKSYNTLSGGDPDIFYRMYNTTSHSWSGIQLISTNSSLVSESPKVAVDSHGNVYVVWYDFSYDVPDSIFCKEYNASARIWGMGEMISSNSTDARSPELAVDHHDNVHVFWYEFGDAVENGQTIVSKIYNSTSAVWISQNFSTDNTIGSSFPDIVIDMQDNIHVLWIDSYNSDNGIPDDNVIYKMYNTTTQDWSHAEIISTETDGLAEGPSLTMDSHGNVHVVWDGEVNYDNSGTDYDIFYKMYNVTLHTWSMTEVISTESTGGSRFPMILIDPQNRMYAFWDDETYQSGMGTNVYYKIFNDVAQNSSGSVPVPFVDHSSNTATISVLILLSTSTLTIIASVRRRRNGFV